MCPEHLFYPLKIESSIHRYQPRIMSIKFESYKYIHPQTGPHDTSSVLENTYKSLDQLTDKMVVFSHEGYRVYSDRYAFVAHLAAMPECERVFHEVIFSAPQKIKIDIDASFEEVEALEIDAASVPVSPSTDDVLTDPDILQLFGDDVMGDPAALFTDTESKYKCVFEVVLQAIRDAFFIYYGILLGPVNEIICESRGPHMRKYSNHIIIDGYYVSNHHQAHEFTRRVVSLLPAAYRSFIDQSVNKSIQNFRIADCHKHGDDRVKRIISGHALIDTLIAHVGDCQELADLVVPISPNTYDALHTDDLKAVLDLCYSDPYIACAHKYRFTKKGLLIFHRTRPSDCEFCARVHDVDNTLIVSTRRIGRSIAVYKHCRKYMKEHEKNGSYSTKIGEVAYSNIDTTSGDDNHKTIASPATENVAKVPAAVDITRLKYVDAQVQRAVAAMDNQTTLFDGLPPTLKNVYSETTLNAFELTHTLVVHAAMKMGKTKALVTYINKYFTGGLREPIIRFISFRQTFSSNIKEKFADFVLYSDVRGPLTASRLIVQVESLYRLEVHEGIEPPDLLVLDECESIFEQFDSGLLKGNLVECFSKFQYLIRYSKHVVCMDANVSDRTFRVLKRMREPFTRAVEVACNSAVGPHESPIVYHHNTYRNATADQYYIGGDKLLWLGALYSTIESGKRVSIPISSLSEAKTLHVSLRKRFPSRTIKLYSSETALREKREHFADVNSHWAQYDVIIYTPTVSAGVSFEAAHFDVVFGYFTDRSCPVETCQQMIGRIRNVADHKFYICIAATGNNLPADIAEIQTDVYTRRENLLKHFDETGLRCEYGPDGKITYHTSEYFYLWLENTRLKNLSKNSFVYRFVRITIDTGAAITLLTESVLAGMVNVIEEMESIKELHKASRSEIKGELCNNIANAPDLSAVELEDIHDNIVAQVDITDAQRYAFERHRLRVDYKYEGVIDPQFVYSYYDKGVRRVYKNLTRMHAHESPEHAWKHIQTEERAAHEYLMGLSEHTQYQDINRKYVFDQHRYALSLMKLCGWTNVRDERFIHQALLHANILDNETLYWQNIRDSCVAFEVRTPSLNVANSLRGGDPCPFIEYILKPINKILTIMYGIAIVKVKGSAVPPLWRLQSGVQFAHDEITSSVAHMPFIQLYRPPASYPS